MLVLHIGLPKTGTTFLQRQIFAGTEDPVFLHRRQGPEAEALCRDLRRYAKSGPLVAPFLRHRIRKRLSVLAYAVGVPRFLVSDENIAISAGGFWQGRGPDPLRVAGRIAELLPRERVRVVIGIGGRIRGWRRAMRNRRNGWAGSGRTISTGACGRSRRRRF